MSGRSGVKLWLAALVLAYLPPPCDAQPSAPRPAAQPLAVVARSALVTLDAASAPSGLRLQLRRAADRTPLDVTELRVSVEGRNEPVTRYEDGSWSVPLSHPVLAGERLEVVVAHDGVREILDGRFAAPAATATASPEPAGPRPAGPGPASPAAHATSFWQAHKQTAWWVLNVVIVLIAAIAISRRMS